MTDMPPAATRTDDLLVQLSECESDDKRGAFSLNQAAELLGMTRRRLRAWFQAGLIQPAVEIRGVPYFDFQCIASARTLCGLVDAGVSTIRIRHGLERLRAWMGDSGEALEQLVVLERNGQLLVRMESGLVEPSGQMCFDFGEDSPILPVQPATAEEWFELGCEHEDNGAWQEAIEAYQQALLVGGPDADVCFNLANALFAHGLKREACERYRQVVELCHDHAEAWNNLGVALNDLRRHVEAEKAFRVALHLGFVGAHFNLATLLDSLGRRADARQHWSTFARVWHGGAWAEHAKRRMAEPS
jgi:tetratricopeptide (TPR) repeat protein